MTYTVGISSGIFGAASQEERFAFTSVGLAKKAQYAITKGVNFVQIDLESISEFEENDIEKKMKEIEKLGISFGIHSETVAFGSREFPHLDSAIKPDYRRGHERLITILKNSARIGAKYVLVHSSESIPFQFLARELQPMELVDPWGRNLADFIKANGEIFLQDKSGKIYPRDKIVNLTETWLWQKNEIWRDVVHDIPQAILERAEKSRKLNLRELARRSIITDRISKKKNEKIQSLLKQEFGGFTLEELQQKYGSLPEEEQKKVLQRFSQRQKEFQESVTVSPDEIESGKMIDEDIIKSEVDTLWKGEQKDFNKTETEETFEYFLRLIQSRQLSYGPEKIAYYVMAKWMQENKHPLWKPIIDITIKYYSKKASLDTGKEVSPEQWLKQREIKEISIDDEKFERDFRLWVPSVSALYFYGHFNPKDVPKIFVDGKEIITDFTIDPPKEILEQKKLYFIFETPMAGSGMEDLLRFPQPAQMYYLAKEMNSPWFGIAIDIEHMLMDGLNVEAALAVLPQESGKLIRVIHAGYPSPLGPAHIPIPLGSDQQIYLYKTYWTLRQKGAGKDNEVFMIFERGGGQDPIQQSIIALQLIKKFLEADVPPEKLTLEFYGLDTGQWASSERQKAQILEHAFDPLKGMLQVPEEEHGFLGKSSIEKGKGEEWRKEKYR